MRENIIEAVKKHAEGHIEKHKTNVEVLLQKPVGIGEHPQHIDEVDKLIEKISQAEEKLQILQTFKL